MADVHVWENGDVQCSLLLNSSNFQTTDTAVFVFKRKDNGSEIARVDGRITAGYFGRRYAECTWAAAATGDDELFYVARYELIIAGRTYDNLPEDITVWAKQMKVTLKKEDDSPYENALCRFTQTSTSVLYNLSNLGSSQITSVLRANASGEITYDLQTPGSVTVAIEPPYALAGDAWTKATGKKREAKVKPSFVAVIEWPVEDTTDNLHKQYVNLPATTGSPEFGRVLRVKVKPATTDQGAAGMKVFLKAVFDGANSERTAASDEHAKGATFSAEGALDGNKTCTLDVVLGPAGGDKVTITVGATPACDQATVHVVTWRRLFYQLKGPDFITSTLPAATLPDGTTGYDLPSAVTTQVKKVMDPVFIEYKLLKSFAHAASLYPAHQRVPGAYINATATTVLMQTGDDYDTDHPTAFATADTRTILIKICDGAAGGSETKLVTVEKTMTAAALTVEFAKDYGSVFFDKLLHNGASAVNVTGCEWEAVTTGLDPGTPDTPGPDAAHPAFDNHVPRKGAMNATWIAGRNQWHVRITLPATNATDPGSFVGTAGTADKCPIKVKFYATVHDGWINGCALNGRQLMVMKPTAPKCVAATLCHELGHSMGMTIMPDRNRVPHGMPQPKHVDNGGVYYRNTTGSEVVGDGLRSSHQGPHCADGIGDVTPASLAGKSGTCILYGEGGSDDNKAREAWCATCTKYLKARHLGDVRTSFAPTFWRGDANC